MPEDSGKARPVAGADVATLLFLGVLWGTAFVFITIGLKSFSPLLLVALRFDITGLLMLGIAGVRQKGSLRPQGRAQWTAIGIAAVLNVTGYHALLFIGQEHTAAGLAAIIVAMNPVLTTVFSRGLLKDERVGITGAIGLALGLAGIVLIVALSPGGIAVSGVPELLIAGAIISWSLGSVLVKRTRHGMDVFAFVAWQSLAGAGILHALSLLIEGGGRAVFDFWGVVSLLYLAVASSALGFAIYFTLLGRIGPIRLNFVSPIAAAVAAVGGLLALGEPVELRAIGAFVLIAAGLVLVTRPEVLRRIARGGPRLRGEDRP
jgi:drug/metabolite transporter (DMT)-like permease